VQRKEVCLLANRSPDGGSPGLQGGQGLLHISPMTELRLDGFTFCSAELPNIVLIGPVYLGTSKAAQASRKDGYTRLASK
jgi:hypothetical protein